MANQTTPPAGKRPTLQGRLNQPLTSRAEAIRQLQTMMPLSANAEAELKKNNGDSSSGPKPRAS